MITWLRLKPTAALEAGLKWVGINACPVSQRAPVRGERLPPGTGEPDQTASLARKPVLPDSVRVWVTEGEGPAALWSQIEDVAEAGPEVPVPDPRLPPGTLAPAPRPSRVFRLDAEAGVLYFGDGLRGRRPPLGAQLQVDYDHSAGAAGNLAALAIDSGPTLPAGLKVSNPIATWGGSDAERAEDGERQISQYLRHRDRLVNKEDFVTLTQRTPGVAVGRVEVLPAFHPGLAPNTPGDAAGVVTVMAIPAHDPAPAVLPVPDDFLDAIACWLEPRRLVTTELFVRRPQYKTIWISLALEVVPGVAVAPVRERVKQAVLDAFSPLPTNARDGACPQPGAHAGWPLGRPVTKMEILAAALRVEGVALVPDVRLGAQTGGEVEQVPMVGLDLPLIAGVAVSVGSSASSLDDVRGETAPVSRPFRPVPIVPEEC